MLRQAWYGNVAAGQTGRAGNSRASFLVPATSGGRFRQPLRVPFQSRYYTGYQTNFPAKNSKAMSSFYAPAPPRNRVYQQAQTRTRLKVPYRSGNTVSLQRKMPGKSGQAPWKFTPVSYTVSSNVRASVRSKVNPSIPSNYNLPQARGRLRPPFINPGSVVPNRPQGRRNDGWRFPPYNGATNAKFGFPGNHQHVTNRTAELIRMRAKAQSDFARTRRLRLHSQQFLRFANLAHFVPLGPSGFPGQQQPFSKFPPSLQHGTGKVLPAGMSQSRAKFLKKPVVVASGPALAVKSTKQGSSAGNHSKTAAHPRAAKEPTKGNVRAQS